MNKPNLSSIAKSVRTTLAKHSPEILTGIGIAGMITSTVLAVRATPKALKCIEEEKQRLNEELTQKAYEDGHQAAIEVNKLKPMDTLKVTWKCYIPAAVTSIMSAACLIGASSVNVKRNAALATAYTLSETALKEYQEKVIETIGEKKEQAVRDSIAKDKIERDPVSNHEIIVTGKGTTRCYDSISGRYFESDIEKIRKIENELNRRMMSENYISLNELYSELGLRTTRLGDELGWRVDKGLIDIHFSAQLSDDGVPCLVLEFNIAPKRDYSTFL